MRVIVNFKDKQTFKEQMESIGVKTKVISKNVVKITSNRWSKYRPSWGDNEKFLLYKIGQDSWNFMQLAGDDIMKHFKKVYHPSEYGLDQDEIKDNQVMMFKS